MLPWLDPYNDRQPFPDPATALEEPDGLLAVGGSLSATRLLAGYRLGIFPWYSAGQPILWWSPNPRTVLFPDQFHCSRSLRKTLRRQHFHLTLDRAFEQVIQQAALPRRDQAGTWITPAMARAYTRLYELGYAHSVETWHEGELVGGLYGVALGRVFYGESMFSRMTDASKVALTALVAQLRRWEFGLIDCQMYTRHLASLGAREIPRPAFMDLLDTLCPRPGRPGRWTLDEDLPLAYVEAP